VQPIEIRLQPSRLLLGMQAVAHLGALAIVLAVPLANWIKAITGFAALASMGYAIWRHALLRGRTAVVAVKVSQQGMEIMLRNGAWLPAKVLASSFVSPWLVVLHLKLAKRRFMLPLVLLPDAMGDEDFRRLRVWLLWSSALRHGVDDPAML
jgi:toxin CptA